MTGVHEKTARQRGNNAGGENPTSDHIIKILVNSAVAAEILDISARTLWSLTRCGAIPCVHIGRLVKYRPDDLFGWVEMECPTAPGSAEAVRKRGRR